MFKTFRMNREKLESIALCMAIVCLIVVLGIAIATAFSIKSHIQSDHGIEALIL
mgnify:CR=1 FL=1